jgi:ABC-type lipoprotein release transport system permease subunit
MLISVVGIVVSIVIIVASITFVYGIENLVTKELSKFDFERVINVYRDEDKFLHLDDAFVSKIKSTTGVESVEEKITIGGKLSYSGSTLSTTIYSVTPNYLEVSGIELPDNTFIEEIQSDEPQPIVINDLVAEAMGFEKPKDMLAEVVTLDYILDKNNSKQLFDEDLEKKRVEGQQFRVVAYLEGGSTPYVYTPRTLAVKSGAVWDDNIKVILSDSSKIDTVGAQIELMGYRTENVIETIKKTRSFFSLIRNIALVVAFFAYLVAIISFYNYLNSTVRNGSWIYSYLRLLGLQKRKIFLLEMYKNALVVAISGFLGVILGVSFSFVVAKIIGYLARKQGFTSAELVYAPVLTLIIVFVVNLAIGMFVIYFPSKKASGISAMEALN